ncbi:MAG: hypothetical protein MJ125_03230 [Clostridia bacterium]|nr:hypothetical protein [Clostridia bacterium]
MKKNVLNKKTYPPKCEYCQKGKVSPDGETVLCKKKGIVERDFSCRSYKYDVLKRKPLRRPVLEDINPQDFEI